MTFIYIIQGLLTTDFNAVEEWIDSSWYWMGRLSR